MEVLAPAIYHVRAVNDDIPNRVADDERRQPGLIPDNAVHCQRAWRMVRRKGEPLTQAAVDGDPGDI